MRIHKFPQLRSITLVAIEDTRMDSGCQRRSSTFLPLPVYPMSLFDALSKYLDDELAQEGITPQPLAMVDLSVAYSPVIPFAPPRR